MIAPKAQPFFCDHEERPRVPTWHHRGRLSGRTRQAMVVSHEFDGVVDRVSA